MFVVFDIGATNTRVASSPDGESLESVVKFGTLQDFDAAMEEMKSVIEDIAGGGKLEGIAGGIAGALSDDGTLLVSHNLPEWKGLSVKDALNEYFGILVEVGNDADLGGLGEAVRGVAREKSIVAYITIGTGVGGTRIVDGSIDRSAFGFEPGQQILNRETGETFEELVSGSGVLAHYGVEGESVEGEEVWAELEETVTYGLYNTLLHWSPDILVLDGSLVLHHRYDPESITERLQDERFVLPKLPMIKKAELGDNSVLHGALALLSERIVEE